MVVEFFVQLFLFVVWPLLLFNYTTKLYTVASSIAVISKRREKREKNIYNSDDNPIYRNALQNKSIKEKKGKKSWVCFFRPSTGCSVCFFLNKKRNEAEKERQTDSIIGE